MDAGILEIIEEVATVLFVAVLLLGIIGYPIYVVVSIKKNTAYEKELERKREIEDERKRREREKARKAWQNASPEEKESIRRLTQPQPTNNELLEGILYAVVKLDS